MTDKVQKIREEVERLQNELIQEKENGFGSDTDDACILELQNVLTYIDSLQEDPVSEDLEEEIDNYVKKNGYDGLDSIEEVKYIANHFAKWGKNQAKVEIQAQSMALAYGCPKESITEDLGEYVNELSKQFPEVSFAKLSRIAVRVAKWQKGHLWKLADGDNLPDIDKEVIALTQPYPDDEHLRVVFAHRPSKYTKVWNYDLGEEYCKEVLKRFKAQKGE